MYYHIVCIVSLVSLFVSTFMAVKSFRLGTKIGGLWFIFNAIVSFMAYEMSVKIICL